MSIFRDCAAEAVSLRPAAAAAAPANFRNSLRGMAGEGFDVIPRFFSCVCLWLRFVLRLRVAEEMKIFLRPWYPHPRICARWSPCLVRRDAERLFCCITC
jgi:hypothetical protein